MKNSRMALQIIRKILSLQLMAIMLLNLFPLSSLAFSSTYHTSSYCSWRVKNDDTANQDIAISQIGNQSFSNITVSQAKNYIRHFISNTANYLKVPNSGGRDPGASPTVGSDGTYTVQLKSDTLFLPARYGCAHYASFIAYQIYGNNNGSKISPEKTNGKVTAQGLKEFLQKNAQAGETLCFQNGYYFDNEGKQKSISHFLAFVSCTEDGFFTLQYYGNQNEPFLSFSYYDYFADEINAYADYKNGVFSLVNTNTATNGTTSSESGGGGFRGDTLPSAPTGFTAIKASSSTAQLSWTPVSGATSYEVEYSSPSSNGWRKDPDYSNKKLTSYITTNLGSKTYQFRVCAINSAGRSGWTTITYKHEKGSTAGTSTPPTPPPPGYGTATIQYNANGGYGAPAGHSVVKDTNGIVWFKLSSAIPTRDGYKFLGWRLENSTAYGIDSPGQSIALDTGNAYGHTILTYYAQWEANAPPIIDYYGTTFIMYNANGGYGAPDSHFVLKDSNGVVWFNLSSTKPIRDGYKFLGWRLGNSPAYDIDSPGQSIAFDTGDATGDTFLTYYAQWEAVPSTPKYGTATIRYNANGGSGAPSSQTVPKNSNGVIYFNLSSTKPTRSGYTFLGWRLENSTAYGIDSPGQSIALDTGNATSNTTLTYYAQWKATTFSVLNIEYGRFTVVVPANYTLDCYRNPTDKTRYTYISAKASPYNIYCTQRLTMSDGTTRYFFISGDNKECYFVFTNAMKVN